MGSLEKLVVEAGPRVVAHSDVPPNTSGDFVLLWMIAARRTRHNFAVDRAVEWARALDMPLLVLEALRLDHPYASERFHRFILDGVAEHRDAFEGTSVRYYPFVEKKKGDGKGLLRALAERAAVVVTDEYPCFFLPSMVKKAGQILKKEQRRLEAVDSNCLVPLAVHPQDFNTAAHFRRHMHRILKEHLEEVPVQTPLQERNLGGQATIPLEIERAWPLATKRDLEGLDLESLDVDHEVKPTSTRGGELAAQQTLARFLRTGLDGYGEDRSHPDRDGTSRLSPYLHFGMVGVFDVWSGIRKKNGWEPSKISPDREGKRQGWWGLDENVEAFLDELITWRELSYNTCHKRPDSYDKFHALLDWAKQTLAEHETDERPHLYERAQLERAETHDEVFNAAMRQLRQEGWFHNYLRMIWGKRILEWSPSPQVALSRMEYIMNRWSLDGRDPNSYAGYFWTLGRYDRGWTERKIYGKVRYMSSDRAKSKVEMSELIE